MQLRPRAKWTLPDYFLVWIFSLHPFFCDRCSSPQRKLRITWRTLLMLLLAGGFTAGAYYLVKNPPSLGGATPAQTETVARSRTGMGGELSAFEQMMIRKPKQTLNNATIMQLWKADVGTNVILQLIRTSNADYDMSAGSIIELKHAGVDQLIILAMIDASNTAR